MSLLSSWQAGGRGDTRDADGRVATWGHGAFGGDSMSVKVELNEVDTIYLPDEVPPPS